MIAAYQCPVCSNEFQAEAPSGIASQVECPTCNSLIEIVGVTAESSIAPQSSPTIPAPSISPPAPEIQKESRTENLPAIQRNTPSSKARGAGLGGALGNVIWMIPCGFLMFLAYIAAGILSCITIFGIGSGLQSFKLASYALSPFVKKIVMTERAGGCLATLGNIIWFLFGGLWLAVAHVLWGILFTVLIVTIPFGKRNFEMAGLALAPYGKRVVSE